MSSFSIQEAKHNDIEFLSNTATATFFDTYVAINPENREMLAAFVQETFNVENITYEFAKKNVHFYILKTQNQKVGYAKTVVHKDASFELEKLYLYKAYQKKGFGLQFFNLIKEKAREQGLESLWLSVYDQNKNAIDFYLKIGFKRIGQKAFTFNFNGLIYKDQDWVLSYQL